MTTKEKITQYIDYKGISKRDFYRQTGLSNGFLDSGKHIGSDNLKIIISAYPEINLEWLVMDDGEMLKTKSAENTNKKNVSINVSENVRKRKVQNLLTNEDEKPNVQKRLHNESVTQSVTNEKCKKGYTLENTNTIHMQTQLQDLKERLQDSKDHIDTLKERVAGLIKDKERLQQEKDNWEHRYNLAQAEIQQLKNMRSLEDTRAGVG